MNRPPHGFSAAGSINQGMERVKSRFGRVPLLLICPHGADDINTGILTEAAAERLNCWYVINQGWKRSDSVNFMDSRADCNAIHHIRSDVVRQEFLEPIEDCVGRILRKNSKAFIFIVHGVGNDVRSRIDPKLDIILGCGNGGMNPSPSCSPIIKDSLAFLMENDPKSIWTVYESVGSQYAGRSPQNLNQLYQQTNICGQVESMQLEIVQGLRSDAKTAMKSGDRLASILEKLFKFCESDFIVLPKNFKIKLC